MLVEACKLFFPPLPPRTKPPHQTRPKQNRLPGHFRHSRLPSRSWGPGSGSLAGRDSFCSICGFALDTARFGCQRTLTHDCHVRRTGPARADGRNCESGTLTGTTSYVDRLAMVVGAVFGEIRLKGRQDRWGSSPDQSPKVAAAPSRP